jgi:hypothetical protein
MMTFSKCLARAGKIQLQNFYILDTFNTIDANSQYVNQRNRAKSKTNGEVLMVKGLVLNKNISLPDKIYAIVLDQFCYLPEMFSRAIW